jgi:hypothetical protein
MSRHCRAFRRQLEVLTRTARRLSVSLDDELLRDFERRISDALRDK